MILRLVLIYISIRSAFSENDGYCALYRGEICKNYINNTQFVWYVKYINGTTRGDAHEAITASLWEELILTLKEPCRSAAEVKFFNTFKLFHSPTFNYRRNYCACMRSLTVINPMSYNHYPYATRTALSLKNNFVTTIGHISKTTRSVGSIFNQKAILSYQIVIYYRNIKL